MTESNPQDEKPKNERRLDPELLQKGLRCDLDQYDMLIRCSEKESLREWNKWRMKNPTQDVLLEGADFSCCYLRNASLNQQERNKEQTKKVSRINSKVYFKGANFASANLTNSRLTGADLEKVHLIETCLCKASLRGARLKGATAWSACFQHANLTDAILESSDLQGAYLEGACISGAHLEGASFHIAHVDSSTLLWACKIDCKTNFSGVSLNIAQIDPATKQLLEYNIRRKNWEKWYKYKDWQGQCQDERHIVIRKLMWFIRSFWSFSDYGRSIGRIAGWFFGLSLFFAVIYSNMAHWLSPGIVSNLEVEPHLPLWHYGLLVFLRPIYFSVVTMTTLGFGDMYANTQSIWGHILLTVQVILGYVLLGALVTRFAVLFTAGGPAGKFANEKEE